MRATTSWRGAKEEEGEEEGHRLWIQCGVLCPAPHQADQSPIMYNGTTASRMPHTSPHPFAPSPPTY